MPSFALICKCFPTLGRYRFLPHSLMILMIQLFILKDINWKDFLANVDFYMSSSQSLSPSCPSYTPTPSLVRRLHPGKHRHHPFARVPGLLPTQPELHMDNRDLPRQRWAEEYTVSAMWCRRIKFPWERNFQPSQWGAFVLFFTSLASLGEPGAESDPGLRPPRFNPVFCLIRPFIVMQLLNFCCEKQNINTSCCCFYSIALK